MTEETEVLRRYFEDVASPNIVFHYRYIRCLSLDVITYYITCLMLSKREAREVCTIGIAFLRSTTLPNIQHEIVLM